MEALQFDPITKALKLTNIDIPLLENSDDVLVEVAYAGICGTDLHIMEGKFPSFGLHEFTLGHEFCGLVHKVGKQVENVKKGDRVGIDPQSSCGSCKFCRTGRYHICPGGGLKTTLGIFKNGGWAKYCRVPAKQVYMLPPNISLKQAVLCEPLSCVCHGLSRISPLQIGSRILVNGAGIIGNLWCSMLHYIGHRNVLVSEPQKIRRELNIKQETGFVVASPTKIKEMCSVDGVDVCIDCSGNGPAMEFAMDLLNFGGKLCIFGVASPGSQISVIPFDIFIKELTICGVTINRYSFQHAIDLIEGMGSRYIDYSKLGIKEFAMDQYQEAFNALKTGEVSKAILTINDNLE